LIIILQVFLIYFRDVTSVVNSAGNNLPNRYVYLISII